MAAVTRLVTVVDIDDRAVPAEAFDAPVVEVTAALTATAVEAEQWWHDIREGGDELSDRDAPTDPWERAR